MTRPTLHDVRLCLIALWLCTAAGCGGDEAARPPGEARAGAGADAGRGAGACDDCEESTGAIADPSCVGPLLACAGECVDPNSDGAHCGGCDQICADGERCAQGACAPCAAQQLAGPLPIALELDTRGQGDLLQPSCGSGAAGEVAVAFRAPHAATFVFSTEGSSFNTVLYALGGGCGGEELACNDDRAQALTSLLELQLEQGEAVTLVVDGFEGQHGRAQLHVSEAAASSCCGASAEPGCAVSSVQECVCAIDELCCTLAWDAACVELVSAAECGSCGAGSSSCTPDGSETTLPATLSGTLADADDRIGVSCGLIAADDALFAYTAPDDGHYTFDTAGSTVSDTVLAVLDGPACGAPELACNDDFGDGLASQVTVELAAGQEVLVAVESWDGETAGVSVSVSAGEPAAAACAPSAITGALPLSVEGIASVAQNALTPSCALFGSAGDVLYEFIAEQAGRYRFDTAGSSADTVLQLLDGGCDGSELACNDDTEAGALQAAVELELAAGQSVVVNVDSVTGEGEFVLAVSRAL